MEYVKAEVTRIETQEDDVITASGCTNAASGVADNCTSDTYISYQNCASNALFNK